MFAARRALASSARNPVLRPVTTLHMSRRALGSVSAIDSSIFRSLFGTEEIRKVCVCSSSFHISEVQKCVSWCLRETQEFALKRIGIDK